MITPIMKNIAAIIFERLSMDSRIPAYPTTAPNTGSAQHVLATALASPSRKAKGRVTWLVPAIESIVLAHSESWKIRSMYSP
jgi:hypothetical protein